MPALNLKWSQGNSKLKKTGTISFNLPAFRSADGFAVCPKAGACATLCYARQGRYIMKQVAEAREFNLSKVRADLQQFYTEAVADLARLKSSSIRVHDSGDFFSQEYMDTWFRIARAFPKKHFYAYTKSLHLGWREAPKNFQIIQSVGGLLDSQINTRLSHSKIFSTVAMRKKAGYVDGNKNDLPAIKGQRKIGLVYHGNKNLKPGQVTWLNQL